MNTDRKSDEQSRQTTAATGSSDPTTGATSGARREAGSEARRTGSNPTASECTTPKGISWALADCIHDCRQSSEYHQIRRVHLNQCYRWMMVAVLISGSSAAAALSVEYASVSVVFMVLTAAFGTINAVFNLPDRARDHEILARRFQKILTEIESGHDTSENILRWRSTISCIYEDEPDTYYALNAVCYNAAAQAAGMEDRQKVGAYHHCLRNWFRFTAEDFPPSRPSKDAGRVPKVAA